jgi:hypothetical protein
MGDMRRPRVWVGGLAIAAAVAAGFGLGRLTGADDDSAQGYVAFEATVESVEADGRRACLVPLDPVVLERLGGPYCGRVFVPDGRRVDDAVRWHVESFRALAADDESVEVMVLSPAS